MTRPPPTRIEFGPGGDVLSVSVGQVEIDPASRSAKEVFAPGPGWLLTAWERAEEHRWAGVTRTAVRERVHVRLVLRQGGGGVAELESLDEVSLATWRQRSIAAWLGRVREPLGALCEEAAAQYERLAADEDELSSTEAADIDERFHAAVRALRDGLRVLELPAQGPAVAELVQELQVEGTPELPFRRPMAALVPHPQDEDFTAIAEVLHDLGFSVEELPRGCDSLISHLEETRLHCAVLVIGRVHTPPEGAFDAWVERFLGPVVRIERAELAPARFRTTPTGRLQLDRGLTPEQVREALQRHAQDRGITLG